MKSFNLQVLYLLLINIYVLGQSVSFYTFRNPVIPGDHPDCTISKVGNDFYTTGSSFNPTPIIYHSTDLVHWEAVARPVSAGWSGYGDSPGGGCWGGHIAYHNDEYWDYFSRGGSMYFVKAPRPEGPWGTPVRVNNPSSLPYSLGYDNSIFIDDNNKWYLVVKNGQPNNGIVELGDDGQPTGVVFNLTRDLSGGQKVMRSDTLIADESSWEMLGDFFNVNDPQVSSSLFTSPNHASPVVTLDDSTFWVMHPLYAKGEWKGQGRQGLLNQVHYNSSDKPVADYPINTSFIAPNLPCKGIPWMVPHTDFFNSDTLNPEWSFLGYTPENKWSLTDRSGWLRLSPKSTSKANTLIKNDGEHNYSIITKLDFNPGSTSDQAGLWIMRGDEAMDVKLVSSLLSSGDKSILFSFDNTRYEIENSIGDTLWLKLVRVNHKISGYFSNDGFDWAQVGQTVDVSAIDSYSDFSTFTGTRQGLYVSGIQNCWFDLYIYRDAYTPILAECPANQLGTKRTVQNANTTVLDNIYYNNWAMYAGVEFGNNEYQKHADSIEVITSSATDGGIVEVYIDSIDASTKIAECNISGTGSWTTFETFSAKLLSPVSGKHDVYLLFTGSVMNKLFMLHSFYFTGEKITTGTTGQIFQDPSNFDLEQNYPNPFNPTTVISYQLPVSSNISLKVYDLIGQEITTLFEGFRQAGNYSTTFNAKGLSSGIYLYRLDTGNFEFTKKALLLR
ncbi:MAG: family 43 glycosylhydrolase [Ignavibacteriaceae bacterium]